ncbi:MAG: hypothetical protein [Microviridae sp.]|nr:MAG: hypothetical protein [Microviridae sp.]
MYRNTKALTGSLKINTSYQGETIEQKINRITNNKEPITDGAPLIYTNRSEGTRPEYDVRTDRFEIAVEAMDKVTKAKLAKREQNMGEKAKEGMDKEAKTNKEIGGAEPIQGTDAN